MKKSRDYDFLEVGMLTEGQLADVLGKSTDTIRYWRKKKYITPSGETKHGTATVHLYSIDEMSDYEALAGMIRPGRKKKTDA